MTKEELALFPIKEAISRFESNIGCQDLMLAKELSKSVKVLEKFIKSNSNKEIKHGKKKKISV